MIRRVAVAVALGAVLLAPARADATTGRLHLAIGLERIALAPSQAARISPHLGPADALVLVFRPRDSLWSLIVALNRIHRRDPIPQLMVLARGTAQIKRLAPVLPPFVHWVGDDYEPGYEPGFSPRPGAVAREFLADARALALFGRHLFVAPAVDVLRSAGRVGWTLAQAARRVPWIMPQTQYLSRRPRHFLALARHLVHGSPPRIRIWPEVTLGSPQDPRTPSGAALHLVRRDLAGLRSQGFDGALLWHEPSTVAGVVRLLVDLRGH